MTVFGGVPIKPFRSAKNRLAAHLSIQQRLLLAQFLGKRALAALRAAGADAVALAADEEVADWARSLGYRVLMDGGSDLNSAAASAAVQASLEEKPWLLVHGDLPLIDPSAVSPALAALAAGRAVLAPSPDGGTPVLGWHRSDFKFRYGPGSFHTHHRQLASHHPLVLTDRRFVFDIDRPRDLALVLIDNPELADHLSSLPGS